MLDHQLLYVLFVNGTKVGSCLRGMFQKRHVNNPEHILTVFRWTVGHVELVNLFCIVLSLRVILSATLLSVSPQLLNELLGAVIQRQNLIRYLTWTCCLRRAGHPEFTENLSADRLNPLFPYVIDIHSGASG